MNEPVDNRILVWFSCGASSAVAAKMSLQRWGKTNPVEVVRVALPLDEHPDNERFAKDVESWIGCPIRTLKSSRYKSIDDVFLRERFIAGPYGAACTTRMKRMVQAAYQRPTDRLVVGFTSDEEDRRTLLEERFPNEHFLWPLIDRGVTKRDCFAILQASGIELPAMYHLGYEHNNCIGCVKGGMGYWNKIRRDFPEVFARRAAIQRELGIEFGRGKYRFFLDELDPDRGRGVHEPEVECGAFCGESLALLDPVQTPPEVKT